ncbi:MAG: hypothetical protein M3144_07740 [Actinomycetota bacterium]|nr:hypothetical protein [Actinomycetota bacterium]
MRKRWGVLAAGAVVVLLLGGCGDGNGTGDDPVVRTPASTSPSQSVPPGTDY